MQNVMDFVLITIFALVIIREGFQRACIRDNISWYFLLLILTVYMFLLFVMIFLKGIYSRFYSIFILFSLVENQSVDVD